MSVGFRVGRVTVTAELLSRTKRAVSAAAVRVGEVILPAAVKAIVAQRGASVAIPHRYYRLRGKVVVPEKNLPLWEDWQSKVKRKLKNILRNDVEFMA